MPAKEGCTRTGTAVRTCIKEVNWRHEWLMLLNQWSASEAMPATFQWAVQSRLAIIGSSDSRVQALAVYAELIASKGPMLR